MNQGHVRPADHIAAAAIICLAILPTSRSSCIWILQQRDLEAAGHGARIDVLDAFCQGIESRFSNESRGVFVKLEPCHQVSFHRSGINADHEGFLVAQLKAERLGGRMQGRFRSGIGRARRKFCTPSTETMLIMPPPPLLARVLAKALETRSVPK